jgi:hypothetical protein
MRRRSAATIVAAVMVFGSMAFAARPAMALNGAESSFLSYTNGERSSRGIKKLALAGDLTAIARAHSARMAEDGKIYHSSNLGSQVDGNWKMLGENVGKGPTVKSIHDAFMASSSHRVHILDSRYDQVGIGTVTKDDVIYVTEIFADRSSSEPPKPAPKATEPKPVVKRLKVVKRPPPARPQPQILSMLLVLAGLDAEEVDPRTGLATPLPVVVTLRRTPR